MKLVVLVKTTVIGKMWWNSRIWTYLLFSLEEFEENNKSEAKKKIIITNVKSITCSLS